MTDESAALISHVKVAVEDLSTQVQSRAFRAANILRTATIEVLRGERSGRVYNIPGTHAKYKASAPGEAPAVRTGTFRNAWQQRTYAIATGDGYTIHAVVENGIRVKDGKLLGRILDEGAPRANILPRPYKQAVTDKAQPKIQVIFAEPYDLKG